MLGIDFSIPFLRGVENGRHLPLPVERDPGISGSYPTNRKQF